ncbi:hypothetical protein HC928_18825, partial [bacterium]|nr:hypothetical protein [bacterium]
MVGVRGGLRRRAHLCARDPHIAAAGEVAARDGDAAGGGLIEGERRIERALRPLIGGEVVDALR